VSHFGKDKLINLLQGDEDLCDELLARGMVQVCDDILAPSEVERARVAWTLVRELEVNWAGVEIIVRMREELLATRRQLAELAREIRRSSDGWEGGE
jgi:hypothetical protein